MTTQAKPDLNVELSTQRLLIRPLKDSDFSAVDMCLSKRQAQKNRFDLPTDYRLPREAFEGEVKRMLWGNFLNFGLFSRTSGDLLGEVWLSKIERSELRMDSEIGYQVANQYWGKGYATEGVRAVVGYAINVLGLHRIEAGVTPDNVGSVVVLRRSGFVEEGLRRSCIRNQYGEWEDNLCLSILEDDFRAAAAP